MGIAMATVFMDDKLKCQAYNGFYGFEFKQTEANKMFEELGYKIERDEEVFEAVKEETDVNDRTGRVHVCIYPNEVLSCFVTSKDDNWIIKGVPICFATLKAVEAKIKERDSEGS